MTSTSWARVWAAFAVVAVVIPGVFSAAPAPAAAAGSTISGVVYLGDLNTTAAAGEFRIKYSRYGSAHVPSNVVTTNAQGAFTISGLTAGPWVFYYEYLGTGPWHSRWWGSEPYGSEQPGVGTFNLDGTSTYTNQAGVLLESNGSITGRIMLGDGATIAPEGDVEVHWTRYLGGFETETGVGAVGADGYYLLEDLGPSSSYGLEFAYVGSDPRWQDIGYWSINTAYWSSSPTGASKAVRNGAVVNFETTIIPAYLTMTGRVTLGSSGTYAGAGDVVVTATTHPDVLEAGVSATTDADGYYTLTGLRSTSYRLIFTYVGTGDYAAVSRPATGSLAGSTVNITIAPGFTVSGNVGLDLATRPVGAGDVRVTVENWGGGDGPSTLTDSLGNYQIQGLVQGTYGLRFEVVGSDTYPIWYWAPGYPTGSEFRPTPQLGLSSNRSGLDVVIGAGGFIEGEVVDSAGAPIEGATVWATGLHRTGPDQGDAVADMQFSALTEADGSYRISGIPGRYDYIVDFESTGFAPTTWSGYSLYYQPELIRPDQAPLPVDVDAVLYAEGSISGTVTGAGIAEHSDDVWVEVAVFDYGSGRWVRTGDSYAVEPDGTYVVPHLYPDNYRLWARYSGELGSRSISSPTLEVGEGDDITANFGSLLPAEFSFVKTDFTGEAVADLLARSSTGDLYLFRGNGASGWSGQTLVGRGWAKFTAVVTVGDFSGDGFSDVMARNAKGELFVFRGNGAAGWLGSAKVGSGWASFTAIIGPGDFNGDGFVDVLARNAKGDLYMFRGNGSGGWLGSVKVGSGWNSFTAITAAGDFDGDGYADVLARRSTGALFLFPGNGAGGWLPSRQVGAGWNSFNSIVGGSDYSGDGFVDVIVRNTKGELHLFCGDGAGGWLGSVKVGSGWTKLSIAA